MLVRRMVGALALAGAVSMLVACTPDRKRASPGDGPAEVAADEEKLHRAEADFLARNGRYGNEDELVTQGFLAGASSSHDIVLENTGAVGVNASEWWGAVSAASRRTRRSGRKGAPSWGAARSRSPSVPTVDRR